MSRSVRPFRFVVTIGLTLLLAGCLGVRGFNFGDGAGSSPEFGPLMPVQSELLSEQARPRQAGGTSMGGVQNFGRGPIKVALLLPLSGPDAAIGQSMANASRLAVRFIEAHPNIAENTHFILRDTGATPRHAAEVAREAINDGARLILGPLQADQIVAVGQVARRAHVPVIGFARQIVSPGNGVYLLNVLPETEMKRALTWVKKEGRRGIAGAFPASVEGQVLETSFRQQALAVGFSPQEIRHFSNIHEVSSIVVQMLPQILRGRIDTLFIPDHTTAPVFAAALAKAGVTSSMLQLVGSSDWDNDPGLVAQPELSGAVYPALNLAGRAAISVDYQRQFGGAPHGMASIAYTATLLANVNRLSMASPPYAAYLLTSPQGFNGPDGLFRFSANGRADYALEIKKIGSGGAQMLMPAGF